MSSGVNREPALAANYVITIYYMDGRSLQLLCNFGSRADADKYAQDFATRQFAMDWTVEMIH